MNFLLKTATKVGEGIYEDKTGTKTRFSKNQWEEILKNAGINNFEINNYTEDFSGRNDKTRSGTEKLILDEIVIKK